MPGSQLQTLCCASMQKRKGILMYEQLFSLSCHLSHL